MKLIKLKDHIPKGISFTVSNFCKVFYKEKCIGWEWLGPSMIRFDFWFEIGLTFDLRYLSKPHGGENPFFFMAYTHNTLAWVECNIFLCLG